MSKANENTVKDWVRIAARLGMLFTEPKVRAAAAERVKSRVDDLADTATDKYNDVSEKVSDRYDDLVDRVEAAAEAFQGQSFWSSRATGLLLGVGVGVGLGILLAPSSGRETRESIRDKANEVKDRILGAVERMPSTGTEG